MFSNQNVIKIVTSNFFVKLFSGVEVRGKFPIAITFLLLFPLVNFSQTNFQQAEEFFKKEKFSQAKPIFKRHLKQNPKDKKTLEYLGDIAAHDQNWDDAIKYYKALVEEEDGNANFHYKYGGALGMKAVSVNKFRAATYLGDIKRELELAAKLDPNHIDTRWALIEYYLQLPGMLGGSESKATNYAKELQTISPVDGYLAMGHIAEYSERYKEAVEYYKKAVKVGGSPLTYNKLASLYEKNNQPQQALETISKSLKVHKDNNLNYQIGKLSAKYNIEPEYGIDCLGTYLANYSDNNAASKAWAYYYLAQINKNVGKKQLALTWIDKALNEKPNFEEAQNEKTRILAL